MALFPALKTAVRGLIRRPGFSLCVVLTLTLGIGANSAIFSVIDAVLLKPLPYPGADRLVALAESKPGGRVAKTMIGPGRLDDWSRMNSTFGGIAGAYTENVSETSAALPEKVNCARVAPRFFSVMGTPLLLGRGFSSKEDYFGGPSAAVLSEAFWRRRFNADPQVLGKTLRLGWSYTIVGVAPESFRFPAPDVDVWTPSALPAGVLRYRQAHYYNAVGRLKEDATAGSAQADLAAVQGQLAMQYPATDKGWQPAVTPLKDDAVAGARRPLWLLYGAVTLVLLIACSNVACLMLVRASQRERDIAVRFSLGAPRARLVREQLLEAFCLAAAGGVAGLVLAAWGSAFFRQAASRLPRAEEIHLDWRIVTFTLALTVVTTILSGLIPALAATRGEMANVLARGSRTQVGGRHVLEQVLAGTQVALAIMLLIGAGLLIRSMARLTAMSLGFEPDRVLVLHIAAGWGETGDMPRVAHRIERTLATLRHIPGVEGAATSAGLPGTNSEFPQSQFHIAGRENQPGEKLVSDTELVSRDYFRVLGIPLLAGQSCREDPDAKAPRQVLVNRQFVERFLPGENPIGRQVVYGSISDPFEIAGVVGDTRGRGYAKDPGPVIYSCGLFGFVPDPEYLLKTSASPMALANAVRQAVRGIEPNRAVYKMRPLSEAIASSLEERRFQTALFTLFAGMALVLAAVGIYGVISFFVSQRTREIGLRMALGARPGQILSEVFLRGGVMSAAGVVAGVAGALAVSRLMSSLLFGISAVDGVTFVGAPLAIGVVAGIAMWGPALRATRVDPIAALRLE